MCQRTAAILLLLFWRFDTAVAGEPDQAALRFEVASVRLLIPGVLAPPSIGGPGTSDPERVTYGGGSLELLENA